MELIGWLTAAYAAIGLSWFLYEFIGGWSDFLKDLADDGLPVIIVALLLMVMVVCLWPFFWCFGRLADSFDDRG